MNIYLANGLTHVPREEFDAYVAFIHELAEELKPHVVKYALINSDPQLSEKPAEERPRLCYLWDRKMVEDAEIVIAEASYPSIGLGIELQIAEIKNIPIILLYNNSSKNKAAPIRYENPDKSVHELQIGAGFVSLMALGLPNVFKLIPYSTTMEALIKIRETISVFSR